MSTPFSAMRSSTFASLTRNCSDWTIIPPIRALMTFSAWMTNRCFNEPHNFRTSSVTALTSSFVLASVNASTFACTATTSAFAAVSFSFISATCSSDKCSDAVTRASIFAMCAAITSNVCVKYAFTSNVSFSFSSLHASDSVSLAHSFFH